MNISRNNVLPWFLTMAAMLLLVGCAHVISKQVLTEVDRNATFAQVVNAPDAYVGKTVLFGGDIIETKNLPDKTVIAVLQRPLSRRGQPAGGDVSEGRFIIQTPGFLDPAIYSPGRQVTVAGKVLGKEVYPMGEIKYAYPLIEKRELFLWPVARPASAEPRWHFGFGVGTGGFGVGAGF
ncbi:MAG: Slp family lipoprotein [Deltaproteobacteria bacterium]|nr:Slp family lipoprotein [Deltaproteobacteria bacterium]